MVKEISAIEKEFKKAVELFEDESSKESIIERIDRLRAVVTKETLLGFKLLNSDEIDGDEMTSVMIKHEARLKYFKEIEELYAKGLRTNKLAGRNNEAGMDNLFIREIQERKSTVGDVVRDLRIAK